MMIGEEIGTIERTFAVVPVGLSSTGWMKTPVLTIMIMRGLAARRASLSLFTDDPTAAYSDEEKMNPNRKNNRNRIPAIIDMSGREKLTVGGPSFAMIGARSLSRMYVVAIQIICCVSPTAPTPSTLPASSVSVGTLDITTSATRVVFSSRTPLMMVCP